MLDLLNFIFKVLTLYHTIPTFYNPEKPTIWKHRGKRRKCIFSSNNDFLQKDFFLIYIYFVVCKCFQIGPVLKFVLCCPKQQILDSSKLKEIADGNFKFDENGRMLSKWVGSTVGKGELLVRSNFSMSFSVLKKIVLQTHKLQGLFGNG